MSKQSKNTIKSWFKNGTFPNQFHFWDWMDSFFHKDEQIPSGQIENLQNLLDSKVDKKDLPDGDVAISDVSGLNDALDIKVDKEDGKGLSTEDFTPVLKAKLDAVEKDANNYQHPLTHSASMIEETADKAFTSDAEKQANANHIDNVDIHKTSEEIRSEIVDVDIPVTIARQDDVAASADGVLSTIRGGVSETYDTLKKVYDWIFVHDGNADIHKTSEQIRSEIVDEDIPVSLARVSQLTTENIVGSVCETLEEAQDKAYDGYTCYVKTDQKSYVFKLEEEIVLDEENNEVVNQKFIPHEIDTANQDCVASLGGLYDWNAVINSGVALAGGSTATLAGADIKGKVIKIETGHSPVLDFTGLTAGDTGTLSVNYSGATTTAMLFKMDDVDTNVIINTGTESIGSYKDYKRIFIGNNVPTTVKYTYNGEKLLIDYRGLSSAQFLGEARNSTVNGNKSISCQYNLFHNLNCSGDGPYTISLNGTLDDTIYTFILRRSGMGSSMKMKINNYNFPTEDGFIEIGDNQKAIIQTLKHGGYYYILGYENSTPVKSSNALSADSTYLPPKIEFTADTPLISKDPLETVTLSYNVWGNLKNITTVEVLDKDDGVVKLENSITNNNVSGIYEVSGLNELDGAQKYSLRVTYDDASTTIKKLTVESVEAVWFGEYYSRSSHNLYGSHINMIKLLIPKLTKTYKLDFVGRRGWALRLMNPTPRRVEDVLINGNSCGTSETIATSWAAAPDAGAMWMRMQSEESADIKDGTRKITYDSYSTASAGLHVGDGVHGWHTDELEITIKYH